MSHVTRDLVRTIYFSSLFFFLPDTPCVDRRSYGLVQYISAHIIDQLLLASESLFDWSPFHPATYAPKSLHLCLPDPPSKSPVSSSCAFYESCLLLLIVSPLHCIVLDERVAFDFVASGKVYKQVGLLPRTKRGPFILFIVTGTHVYLLLSSRKSYILGYTWNVSTQCHQPDYWKD